VHIIIISTAGVLKQPPYLFFVIVGKAYSLSHLVFETLVFHPLVYILILIFTGIVDNCALYNRCDLSVEVYTNI